MAIKNGFCIDNYSIKELYGSEASDSETTTPEQCFLPSCDMQAAETVTPQLLKKSWKKRPCKLMTVCSTPILVFNSSKAPL